MFDGISARMTRHLWIASVATLAFAACSKSDTEPARMMKPVEVTTPEVKASVEATPTVARAPAIAPPAPPKPPTKQERAAIALLHEIARTSLQMDRFDTDRAFALIDLTTTPDGEDGGQHRIIKGLCASQEEGLEAFDPLGDKLHADAAQLKDAFAKDAVTCTTTSANLVTCNVRAYQAGKATLSYLVGFANGRTVVRGYARRDTLGVTSDRLAADDKTIEAAFARLGKKVCLSPQ